MTTANADKFDKLATETCDAAHECFQQIRENLDVTAQTLLERATELGDIAVPSDKEEQKRETIAMWRQNADMLRQFVGVLCFGYMPATEFRDEVHGMLQRGMELFLSANQSTAPRDLEAGLRDLMLERARNISQAYQGRVVREAGK